jgi:hypothetical protein
VRLARITAIVFGLARMPTSPAAFPTSASQRARAVEGFVSRTEELRGALDVQAARVVATRTGSTLEAVPADAASAWGLLPALVVVDELAGWASTQNPRRLWEAVTSAVAVSRGGGWWHVRARRTLGEASSTHIGSLR